MNTICNLLNNESVLYFIIRVILGILFFFQGYDKVFNVKVPGVINFFAKEWGLKKPPMWVLSTSTYFTSYAELIGGALLIIGLFKPVALYILGIDLLLVTAAFSMIKPMWDMQLVFPRLILLSILLYLPVSNDILSADYFLCLLRN